MSRWRWTVRGRFSKPSHFSASPWNTSGKDINRSVPTVLYQFSLVALGPLGMGPG